MRSLIIQDLHNFAPLPWRGKRYQDAGGWSHGVVDADDKCLGDRLLYLDQNALLVTVHAFGPEAMDYVLRSAERGGKEAVDIAERFMASLKSAREEVSAPIARRG